MLVLSDSVLILACISPMAFRQIASAADILIIGGILLEAWVLGRDLQEPQDLTQIISGQGTQGMKI